MREKMDCQEAKNLLSDYVDNQLNLNKKNALEKHLTACSKCSTELELLKMTVGALKSLPLEEMPKEAAKRLHQRLGIEKSTKQRRFQLPDWLLSPLAPIAATAVVVILAIVITLQGQRQTTMTVSQKPKSSKIIAEISKNLGKEELNKPLATESRTRRLAVPYAVDRKSLGNSTQDAKLPPLVKVSSKNYSYKEVAQLLQFNYQKPISSYQEQKSQLLKASGKHRLELLKALKATHKRRPKAKPVFAELARYRNQTAWIIILEESSIKRAVIIKAD